MCSKSFEILRIHGNKSSRRNVFMLSKKKFWNIAYTGDGDLSSYQMVAQALKEKSSDQYKAVEEDCIGHIQNLCNWTCIETKLIKKQ